MFLDEKVMKTFCVAKSFKDNDGGRVNSLHFSWNGLSLITSSEDDQIVIYDCERGDQKRLVNSQKYGVDLARFTHGQDSFTARLLDKHNSSKNMLYCQNFIFWFSYQDLHKLLIFIDQALRNTCRHWEFVATYFLQEMERYINPFNFKICMYLVENFL